MKLTMLTIMTHCRWRLTVQCAGYLAAAILGWAALALVVVALVALWRAHGVIGVMLLAALVLLAAIVVLGPRWARQMIKRELSVSQQEIVDGVVAQLGKAKAEILAEIDRLASANPALDLSALVAAAQGLDDVVPDVKPEPEPEPVDPEFGVVPSDPRPR